jgi:VanZ like family.
MRKRNIIGSVLLVAYLAAVAYCCLGRFSSVPSVPTSFFGIPTDKIVHFVMFFPFPILAFLTFDRHTTKPWHSILMASVAFLAGCLIAGGTEIAQSFTDYRSCDKLDFLSDVLSLALSSVIVLSVDLWKMRGNRKF